MLAKKDREAPPHSWQRPRPGGDAQTSMSRALQSTDAPAYELLRTRGALHDEAQILFVSDDDQLRALSCELLTAHGCGGVRGADSLAVAASSNGLRQCAVAIVDMSGSGAAAERALRKLRKSSDVSVIAIGAPNTGLPKGDVAVHADVLLARPFDPRELVLIVRGMLYDRGRSTSVTREALSVGPITLNTLLNAATIATREVALTGVETRILAELLASASHPVDRDRLTRRALGREWSPFDRCLDTHIKRLRRKIGDDVRGRTPIRTIRGLGYLLLAEWEPRA